MKAKSLFKTILFLTLSVSTFAQFKNWENSLQVNPYARQYLGKYGSLQYKIRKDNSSFYVGLGFHYNKTRFTRNWKGYSGVDNGHAHYFNINSGFGIELDLAKGISLNGRWGPSLAAAYIPKSITGWKGSRFDGFDGFDYFGFSFGLAYTFSKSRK